MAPATRAKIPGDRTVRTQQRDSVIGSSRRSEMATFSEFLQSLPGLPEIVELTNRDYWAESVGASVAEIDAVAAGAGASGFGL